MLEWLFLIVVLLLGAMMFTRFQERSVTTQPQAHNLSKKKSDGQPQKVKSKRLNRGALVLTEERRKTSSRKVPLLNMEADVVKLNVISTSVEQTSKLSEPKKSQSSAKSKPKPKTPKVEEMHAEPDIVKQQAALNARIQKFVLAAGKPKKTKEAGQESTANIKVMERVSQQSAPWSAKAY